MKKFEVTVTSKTYPGHYDEKYEAYIQDVVEDTFSDGEIVEANTANQAMDYYADYLEESINQQSDPNHRYEWDEKGYRLYDYERIADTDDDYLPFERVTSKTKSPAESPAWRLVTIEQHMVKQVIR